MKKTETDTETDGSEVAVAVEVDAMPVVPDRADWTPQPSEHRDFWRRIRALPPEVVGWRRSLLKGLAESLDPFSLQFDVARNQLQDRLDVGISYLRAVARIRAVSNGIEIRLLPGPWGLPA
jgi:hypothetical protein